MRKLTCSLAVAVVALCTAFSTPSTAYASSPRHEVVRIAQIHLVDLGYPVGEIDGVYGPLTRSAVMNFQRDNGLPKSGLLTELTLDNLVVADFDYRKESRYYHSITSFAPPGNVSYVFSDSWHNFRTQTLPIRFGSLSVTEDNRGTLHHYTITLNGRTIMQANNQPSPLRISRTFNLRDEDAVIVTGYQGHGECSYKNYLFVIHSNNTFTGPSEIGNCNVAYDAHVVSGALVVNFPESPITSKISTWDMWRYDNNSLVHM